MWNNLFFKNETCTLPFERVLYTEDKPGALIVWLEESNCSFTFFKTNSEYQAQYKAYCDWLNSKAKSNSDGADYPPICSLCGNAHWGPCVGTPVTISGKICEQCNGSGHIKNPYPSDSSSTIPCPTCKHPILK